MVEPHVTHCAALVREADRDRYLAALFAPEMEREALFALYAFDIEIGRARELAREPMPGEIRLQWWREVLEGKRDGEAAGHPVASALRAMLTRCPVAPEALTALIDAQTFDLYSQPMASLDDLDAYVAQTSGAVFAAAAGILGADAGDLARHAGHAFGITEILNLLGRHAARGQLYVPLEVLERHGVAPETVLAGADTAGLRDALAELRRHALRHLEAARAAFSSAPSQIVPALLPAASTGPQLRRMEDTEHDPFQPVSLSRLRRQWLIWRAARDPRRIFAAR